MRFFKKKVVEEEKFVNKPLYNYEATKKDGSKVEGVMFGWNTKNASDRVRRLGYVPTKIWLDKAVLSPKTVNKPVNRAPVNRTPVNRVPVNKRVIDDPVGLQRLSDVQSIDVQRISTGYKDFDWMYGNTGTNWGFPAGKLSVWAGEKGVGKSRISMEISKILTFQGYKVLYFQNETPLSEFKNWFKTDNNQISNTLYVSNSRPMAQQIKDIEQVVPDVVVIDSVNMIKEYRSASEEAIENLVEQYRTVCRKVNCHIIFLCQLTKDGTARGSTTFPHLVDVEVFISRKSKNFYVRDNWFIAEMGKNRYGDSNRASFWEHTDEGAKLVSENYLGDDKYCKIMGLVTNEDEKLKSLKEHKRWQEDNSMRAAIRLRKHLEVEEKGYVNIESGKGILRKLIRTIF